MNRVGSEATYLKINLAPGVQRSQWIRPQSSKYSRRSWPESSPQVSEVLNRILPLLMISFTAFDPPPVSIWQLSIQTFFFLSFFKIYFIDYAITVVPFFLPLISICYVPPPPPSFPHLSSCPWVVHISSLVSSFPILFLTPLSILYLPFMLLIPSIFPHYPPSLPTDNPPCDLHFCESVPGLAVCLVRFCFCFLFF